jgi:hypothetical protein
MCSKRQQYAMWKGTIVTDLNSYFEKFDK